jgi:hypothetical protein
MARSKQNHLLILAGITAAAFWLASDPHCSRGCRTMAEHLAEHGLEDLLGGIFGV